MAARTPAPAPGWWNAYVGIPFRDHGVDPVADGGLNCWTLPRWIYLNEWGVLMPSYEEDIDPGTLESQLGTLDVLFRSASQVWQLVPAGQHKPFDIVLMRRGRLVCHTGIVTKPGRMLHLEVGIKSCLEDYLTGMWARRVVGVYRHAQLL